ncbi:MAG: hypothetical protein J6W08_02270 [Alphaproteobacteria bacterium]|nr:hypothetical protein [Alphaproteobacteria bacterium]MBR0212213.1 hypothetical protein [Alphaproteobacteria bacterium]
MGQLVSDVTKVLEYNNAKKTDANERQKILSQIATDEAEKTNLIKKALATQRAKFGGNGNSGNSFSENAVLNRLREEASQPYDKKKQDNLEKIKKIKTKKPNLIKTWLSRIDKIAG